MNDLESLAQKYLVNDEDEVIEKKAPAKTEPAYIEPKDPPLKEEEPKEEKPDKVKAQKKVKAPKKEKAPKKLKSPKEPKDPDAPMKANKKKSNILGRFFLCFFTLILMIIITITTFCMIICYGPSPTVRNICVLSAKQASATKWIPGLFLSDKVIDEILEASNSVNSDTVSVEDIAAESDEEEWDDAIDGMKLIFRQMPNFKAYVLLVKDPSRVMCGVSSDNFATATEGMRIFDIAEKYKCVAAINGGEFSDPGGQGSGGQPIGITYSAGKCCWQSSTSGTFIGLDKDNNLVCVEGMNQTKAEQLGVRDGCCFMYGNVIIERDGDDVKLNYADDNLGIAQKTAIGQRADGTIIMIVTDGRSTDSVGATRNDMIDLMVEYGAVVAGSLDGGSSSMLYYRDYFTAYNIDKSTLDEYQQKGLVNHYKAFTNPRRIPTYFIVMPGE